ncbi:antibiotic biosynthesis monooxygenase family protein [Flavisericum labens]|uniref:antibiotic biosynthesis monooxygenase family protein n=1 Tax=Flavisericum labens TaxID=3377112 RepID=UPI00387AEE9D
MYIVLYAFKIKPNQFESFVKSWEDLTNLIYKYEGSLGSRLHKKSESEYVAYAQWPSKEKFESAGGNLPKKAEESRSLMKASCISIEILSKLEVVKNLFAEKPYD